MLLPFAGCSQDFFVFEDFSGTRLVHSNVKLTQIALTPSTFGRFLSLLHCRDRRRERPVLRVPLPHGMEEALTSGHLFQTPLLAVATFHLRRAENSLRHAMFLIVRPQRRLSDSSSEAEL